MQCCNKCFSRLLLISLTVIFASASFAADSMAPYQTPDLKTGIFGGELTFDGADRKAAATALAGLARNSLDLKQADGARDAARLLGLALRLDPQNRSAVVTNGYLTDGQHPPVQQDWNQDDAIKNLRHAGESAKATGKTPDNAAAAYIYSALLLVRADDDDRFSLEALKSTGIQIDWGYADSPAVQPHASASSVRRPRNAKAGDRAAIQGSLRDSTIHSLIVVSTGEGEQHGQVMDIIAVAPKGQDNPFPRIKAETAIGREMQISLDEAVRLAKLRDPRANSIDLQISFSDKYTAKDGGSAATAFSLLILSSLNQFELAGDSAVTGDITVDGKIRPIGAVATKLRGAALDHMRVAAMPNANLDQLRDAVLVNGTDIVWNTQAIGMDTLDDAIAIMRKDRAASLQQAIDQFDALRKDMAHRPVTELQTNPDAASRLAKIIELAPNHLSAVTLQAWARGQGLKKLSLTGSLEQAAEATLGIQKLLKSQYFIERVDRTAVDKTREKIQGLRKLVDPSVSPILSAIEDYCASADRLAEAIEGSGGARNALQSEVFKKAATVREEFRKLVDNDQAVDKLLRGE